MNRPITSGSAKLQKVSGASPRSASAIQRRALVTHAPVAVNGGGRRIVMSIAGVAAPVGSVEIHPTGHKQQEIINLKVAPEFRRQGIGRQLMEAAVQAAGASSGRLTLQARAEPSTIEQRSLVSMYQKMGFHSAGLSTAGNDLMVYGNGMQHGAASTAGKDARAAQPFLSGHGTAPPVYRPHAAPVQHMPLRGDSSGSLPATAMPLAPMRPGQRPFNPGVNSPAALQRSTAPARMAPPPVYRPGALVAPFSPASLHHRAAHVTPAVAQFKPARAMRNAPVIQRMYSPNMTTSVPNLDTVSRDLSASHGYRETATFAVVNDEAADFIIYGQRYYAVTDDAAPTILTTHNIGVGIDYVTPDSSEGNVHAEMLAISEWLNGNREKPEMIGASRLVCSYCAVVLKYLGITVFSQPSDVPTQNWVSPYYLNGQANPDAIRNQVPRFRSKGKNYF